MPATASRARVPALLIPLLLLLAAALVAVPVRAQGVAYYVAPTGSDANPGTEALPWRTLQKAAGVVGPGDAVYARGGVYRESVTITRSGATGAPITFAAYPGETPILDLNGMALPNYFDAGFRVNGAAHVRITGFVVQNVTDGFGIICYQADQCQVDGNRTYNTLHSGIAAWGASNVVIQGNEVELANNNGEQEAISVANTAFAQVLNNHVHHGGPGTNGGEGIDIKDGSHDVLVKGNYVHHLNRPCIYIDAWDAPTYNITVEANRSHNCFRYGVALASERGGELYNVEVRNNVLYQNVRTGITVADWDAGYAHPIRDVTIINNTIYDNGDGTWGGGIEVLEPTVQRVTIRNNIVSKNDFFTILAEGVPAAALTVDHNLIDGFRGRAGELRGADYVEGDPRFVDPAGADFHLLAGSPAIDRGAAAPSVAIDYDGAARPVNGAWDIGAYEAVATGPTVTPPLATATSLPPTPTPAPTATATVPATATPTTAPTATATIAPTATATPGGARQTIFFDGFESAFSGWYKEGGTAWYTGSPKIGTHSVRMNGNNCWMQRTVPTTGYSDILFRVHLGAGSYEASENLIAYWWNGTAWQQAKKIKNGDPEENGQLHLLEFTPGAAAGNRADFKIAFGQWSAASGDYGYIDNVEVLGRP